MNLNILNLASGYRSLCLRWVRLVFGVASKYVSAKSAWNNAQYRHVGDRNPPRGVPVFFSGIPFGHVAVSLGWGVIRTTAWPSGNFIGNTTIDALCKKWGRTYLGWTEDLNGVRIYCPTPTPPVVPTPKPTTFKEQQMKVVRCRAENNWYLISEFDVQIIASMKDVRSLEKIWGTAIEVEPYDVQESVRRAQAVQVTLKKALS